MNPYYLIADHLVQVADGRLGRLLFDFQADPAGIHPSDTVCTVNLALPVGIHGVLSLTPEHEVSHVLTMERDATATLMADRDYRNVTVYTRMEYKLMEDLLPGLYSRLIYYRTAFAHAALVDVPGFGGLMFVGDSGVGKTTQAVLWNKHRGAEILNGDKVLLGLRDTAPGQVLAYGNPWKGSSPYCVNRSVPLRAIVSLVRREETYIRRLSDIEAAAAYIPRVFMPSWDDRLTEALMETLDVMLPLVPVYEMSCLPDESAVEAVEKTVLAALQA